MADIVLGVPTTGKGVLGPRGPEGRDAYSVAVKNGFSGSEEEWLKSLKGEQGPKGDEGPQGPMGPQGLKVTRAIRANEAPKVWQDHRDHRVLKVNGEGTAPTVKTDLTV